MEIKFGAIPPTYQRDRSESGTAVNFPVSGGSMPLPPLKELPTHAMPAGGIIAPQWESPILSPLISH
jgi:hypothetical protein